MAGKGHHSGLSFFHAAMAFVLSVVGILLFHLLLMGVQGFFNWFSTPLSQLLVSSAAVFTVFVIISVQLCAMAQTRIDKAVGMRRPSLSLLILAVVGVVPAGVLADQVVYLFHLMRPDKFDVASLHGLIDIVQGSSPGAFVWLAIGVSILPAIGEELLFRGIVFNGFRKAMPIYFAVVYSSVLFGLIHLNWIQGVSATLIGIYLSLVYIWSESIWTPMLVHFVNNIIWLIYVRCAWTNVLAPFENGYPWWVILLSLLVLTLAIVGMWRLSIVKKQQMLSS